MRDPFTLLLNRFSPFGPPCQNIFLGLKGHPPPHEMRVIAKKKLNYDRTRPLSVKVSNVKPLICVALLALGWHSHSQLTDGLIFCLGTTRARHTSPNTLRGASPGCRHYPSEDSTTTFCVQHASCAYSRQHGNSRWKCRRRPSVLLWGGRR